MEPLEPSQGPVEITDLSRVDSHLLHNTTSHGWPGPGWSICDFTGAYSHELQVQTSLVSALVAKGPLHHPYPTEESQSVERLHFLG